MNASHRYRQREELLLRLADGVKIWRLTDGEFEFDAPEDFTNEDWWMLECWFNALRDARKQGEPDPSYEDYRNLNRPRVPVTPEEIVEILGPPPADVDLNEIIANSAEPKEEP